ncbi:MAG: filamentous hemagglutinin N-terminal domain-containing protein [Candidatus Omnitrophota bacterium]
MMREIPKVSLIVFLSTVFFLSFSGFTSAGDLPQGAEVVSGQVSFANPDLNTMNITASDKAIINYNKFNIGAQNAVNFIQPSASAVALNRVIGADPSFIQGSLNANGRIFLINPNGVLFGPGAIVDAAGMVASTLGISNDHFLQGRYIFQRDSGTSVSSIENQGNITIRNGGYVALMGAQVKNSGVILADMGNVAMASGNQVTLNLDDQGDMSVTVNQKLKADLIGGSAVLNEGIIMANKVVLTAKSLNKIFDNAVNNTGIISASGLVAKDGVIELVAKGAAVTNDGDMATGSIKISNSGGAVVNNGTISSDSGLIDISAGSINNAGIIDANSNEGTSAGTINLVANGTDRSGCSYDHHRDHDKDHDRDHHNNHYKCDGRDRDHDTKDEQGGPAGDNTTTIINDGMIDAQTIYIKAKNSGIANNGVISSGAGLIDVTAGSINNAGVIDANEDQGISAGIINILAGSDKDGKGCYGGSGNDNSTSITNDGIISAYNIHITAPDSGMINNGIILSGGGLIDAAARSIINFGDITSNAAEGGKAGIIRLYAKDLNIAKSGSKIEASATGLNGVGGTIELSAQKGNIIIEKDAVIDVSGGSVSGNAGTITLNAGKKITVNSKNVGGAAAKGYKQAKILKK